MAPNFAFIEDFVLSHERQAVQCALARYAAGRLSAGELSLFVLEGSGVRGNALVAVLQGRRDAPHARSTLSSWRARATVKLGKPYEHAIAEARRIYLREDDGAQALAPPRTRSGTRMRRVNVASKREQPRLRKRR
jgi:hypothetical protein